MVGSILIIGANGNLGQAITKMAIERGFHASLLVRSSKNIAVSVSANVKIIEADLMVMPSADLKEEILKADAVICAAGNIDDGEKFVALLDKVICAGEALLPQKAPVFWFMAGAAILEIEGHGRKGIDIPIVPPKYRFHLRNFLRLESSNLDWRLCCPGPMIEEGGVGLDKMLISVDVLPIRFPIWAAKAPAIFSFPFFVRAIGSITVPFNDVAELILNNLEHGGPFSRRRIGIALPKGMKKTKK